jgi:hypothetical protein
LPTVCDQHHVSSTRRVVLSQKWWFPCKILQKRELWMEVVIIKERFNISKPYCYSLYQFAPPTSHF